LRSLYIDHEQVLWIGTNGNGLYKIDFKQTKPENIKDSIVKSSVDDTLTILALNQDHQQTLWIGSEETGLYYRKAGENNFNRLTNASGSGKGISNEEVWSLFADRSGVFWVGTFDGLNKWNTRTTQFDHFFADPLNSNSLTDNSITSIGKHKDKLYIGTTKGVDILVSRTNLFSTVPVQSQDTPGISDTKVMVILPVSDEEVWFGHRTTGATKYNPKTNTYIHYQHDSQNPNSIGHNGIPFMLKASDGTIWIATFEGGLSRYNRDTDDFTNFLHDDADSSTLSSNIIMALHESENGNIWVGTWDAGLNIFVPATGAAFRMQNRTDDPTSIGSNSISIIHEDVDGNVWVGTQGGGLNILTAENIAQGKFVFDKLHLGNGMPSNVIYGLLEDADGYIWGSTNRGLVKINRKTKEIITYTEDQGIQANEFNSGAFFKDGEYLYFGGSNGVTRFKPAEIEPNNVPPQIELTKFQRLNKVNSIAKEKNKEGIIETYYTDYLIGFEFAALDYSSPSNNKYKYKLFGFDTDWVEVRDVRRATYTNLPSGEYSFRVIGSNSDGVWNKEGESITLLVHPAPWFSWWAYAIYFTIALILSRFVFLNFKRKAMSNLKYQVKLEREVNQRTAELSEANEMLLHASITDQLTGLHNRRFLADAMVERLESITKRFAEKLIEDEIDCESGPRLMALMFDLDGFKPVNDNYGHEAGDKVIIQVAQILQRECRRDDIVVRWGGDEYMVVAEVINVNQAQALAEKIRCAIANHGFDVGLSNHIHLSSSLGFALYPFSHYAPHSVSWDQVHLLADQALYKSKDAGRNTWTGIAEQSKELPFSTLNSIVPNLDQAIAQNDVKLLQRKKAD
jgi:diguanylate cyclase (GGDEF)-like protein